jgi:hypothetical protein
MCSKNPLILKVAHCIVSFLHIQKNSPRDDDIVRIQSVLRAHAIRRERVRLLGNVDDDVEEDLEWEDAVTRVQSAMRGHHARRKYYSNTERFCR